MDWKRRFPTVPAFSFTGFTTANKKTIQGGLVSEVTPLHSDYQAAKEVVTAEDELKKATQAPNEGFICCLRRFKQEEETFKHEYHRLMTNYALKRSDALKYLSLCCRLPKSTSTECIIGPKSCREGAEGANRPIDHAVV